MNEQAAAASQSSQDLSGAGPEAVGTMRMGGSLGGPLSTLAAQVCFCDVLRWA